MISEAVIIEPNWPRGNQLMTRAVRALLQASIGPADRDLEAAMDHFHGSNVVLADHDTRTGVARLVPFDRRPFHYANVTDELFRELCNSVEPDLFFLKYIEEKLVP